MKLMKRSDGKSDVHSGMILNANPFSETISPAIEAGIPKKLSAMPKVAATCSLRGRVYESGSVRMIT